MTSKVKQPEKLRQVFVGELQLGRTSQKLMGRISRVWEHCSLQKGIELISRDFLLIDEKAECIVCSIRGPDIARFDGLIEEGKVYTIQNFTVSNMQAMYRVWHEHDLSLLLDGTTCIEEVVSDVPAILKHEFRLIPYEQLGYVSEGKKNLCDIIRYASADFDIRAAVRKGRLMAMQKVELTNIRSVKVTIWGGDLTKEAARLISSEKRFWIITPTDVSPNGAGGVCVATTEASRLYNSLDIDEVHSFTSSSHYNSIQASRLRGVHNGHKQGSEYVLGLPATVNMAKFTCVSAQNVEALADEFHEHTLADVNVVAEGSCVGANKRARRASNA